MWSNLDESHAEVECELNNKRIKIVVAVNETMDDIVGKELKLKHRSAAWQKLRLSPLFAIIRLLFRYTIGFYSHLNLDLL